MNTILTSTKVVVLFFVATQFSAAQEIRSESFAYSGPYLSSLVLENWNEETKESPSFGGNDKKEAPKTENKSSTDEEKKDQSLKLSGNRLSQRLVSLDWKLVYEKSAIGYYIERKLEHQSEYEEVGYVDASNENALEKLYDYLDVNEFFGNTYYRIKQVDGNGEAGFSNEIKILGTPLQAPFTVFPSPTKGPLNLGANAEALGTEKELTARITDQEGNKLFEVEIARDHKITKLPDIGHLPAGTYTVSVLADEEVEHIFRVTRTDD